jgi:hypothetical protein
MTTKGSREDNVIWYGSRFTATEAEPIEPRPSWKENRRGTGTALALLLLAVVIGTPSMFLWAIEPTISFFGDVADEAERAESRWRLGLTIAVCMTTSVGAITLAIWQRRAAWAAAFGVLAIGFTMGLALWGYFPLVPNDVEREPLPTDYVACYSGSNDCPGG